MGGGTSPFSSGFPGMSGGGDFMDVDDAPGSPFSSSGPSPFTSNVFGSRGASNARPRGPTRSSSFSHSGPRRSATGPTMDSPPPSDIIRPLKVSLEDLFNGTVKHLKMTKRLIDGKQEEKIIDIDIKPGWKEGTKIRYANAGNERDDGHDPQDVVFVIEEKPHDRFKREGDHIVLRHTIPLVDALINSGGVKMIEGIDGRKCQVTLPPGVIKPGAESRVVGQGWPIRKEGVMKGRGDLIVRWDVVFPDRLTPSQKDGIRKLLP